MGTMIEGASGGDGIRNTLNNESTQVEDDDITCMKLMISVRSIRKRAYRVDL